VILQGRGMNVGNFFSLTEESVNCVVAKDKKVDLVVGKSSGFFRRKKFLAHKLVQSSKHKKCSCNQQSKCQHLWEKTEENI